MDQSYQYPDHSYLIPPKEVYNIVHDPTYILQVNNNLIYRKIYYNQKFTEEEEKRIDNLQQQLQIQCINVPSDWDRPKYLKFCLSGKQLDFNAVLESVKNHLLWLSDKRNYEMNPTSKNILQDGVFYLSCRDKQFRPVIVINLPKMDCNIDIDVNIRALSVLYLQVHKYMFVKGYVENQILILETEGFGIFSLPFSAIKRMVACLQTNFRGTLEKLFIINPSRATYTLWSMIKIFLSESNLSKVVFLQQQDFHILKQYIREDQLEMRYGGTAFNVQMFWPCNPTFKNDNQNNISRKQDEQQTYMQESDYYTIQNDSQYFFNDLEENCVQEQTNIIIDNDHIQQSCGGCSAQKCNIF